MLSKLHDEQKEKSVRVELQDYQMKKVISRGLPNDWSLSGSSMEISLLLHDSERLLCAPAHQFLSTSFGPPCLWLQDLRVFRDDLRKMSCGGASFGRSKDDLFELIIRCKSFSFSSSTRFDCWDHVEQQLPYCTIHNLSIKLLDDNLRH